MGVDTFPPGEARMPLGDQPEEEEEEKTGEDDLPDKVKPRTGK